MSYQKQWYIIIAPDGFATMLIVAQSFQNETKSAWNNVIAQSTSFDITEVVFASSKTFQRVFLYDDIQADVHQSVDISDHIQGEALDIIVCTLMNFGWNQTQDKTYAHVVPEGIDTLAVFVNVQALGDMIDLILSRLQFLSR